MEILRGVPLRMTAPEEKSRSKTGKVIVISSPRVRILGLCSTVLAFATVVPAQTTQPSSAAAAPQTSLLQQISRETQALFEGVRPSLVVVQLPAPRWATALMQ